MISLKSVVRLFLRNFYRIEVRGLEHAERLDDKLIIVANHTSFLDALLIYAFIPIPVTFAINTFTANAWYIKPLRRIITLFPLDPAHPLSLRKLIQRVQSGEKIVIFPEGRITVTGSLMKIYYGPGMVAVKTRATVLPICINGAQYTTFSKLKSHVRKRWFPQITLTLFAPRQIQVDQSLSARAKRVKAGKALSDIMTEMVFNSSHYNATLFDQLLDARSVHGGKHIIGEDILRKPISYDTMITKAIALGKYFTRFSRRGERVGVLLPGALSNLVTFWALHIYGRVPAMLNYTAGAAGMHSACGIAEVKTVITAHAFIKKAQLDDVVEELARDYHIVYLEELAKSIDVFTKIRSFIISKFDIGLRSRHRSHGVSPDSPAVVLFTSGSEGVPKGVVLSHANILANVRQLASKIDFSNQDVVLNPLPLFHSFGLTVATMLPVLYGMKTFLYPSPLHYRVIPEIAYDIGATLMFGTNTFLAGYARNAHPYDFYSVRYVFAGAEKLKDEVRREWETKFGVRIFEGYGATETSPALTMNSPMDNSPGSVGRLLPSIEYRLEPVEGLSEGQRLYVKGPNVMQGYFFHDRPGVLVPPETQHGKGWYDTGDIVTVDAEGFVSICGRAKRFAKVGGEMISLTVVESLASRVWPEAMHAAVAVGDEKKGEQIILLTEKKEADRAKLITQAKIDGLGEINVPRKIMPVKEIPLLGSGKTDYVKAMSLVATV